MVRVYTSTSKHKHSHYVIPGTAAVVAFFCITILVVYYYQSVVLLTEYPELCSCRLMVWFSFRHQIICSTPCPPLVVPLDDLNENGLSEYPGLPECPLKPFDSSETPGYPRRVRVSLSELSGYRVLHTQRTPLYYTAAAVSATIRRRFCPTPRNRRLRTLYHRYELHQQHLEIAAS